ncbi:MAG: AAA family ATPase [Actinomycetota bacterium]|nr:AAA family ATPase [Actinomycetota bacterium]
MSDERVRSGRRRPEVIRPGVYVEEIRSTFRFLIPAVKAVTAFVGDLPDGPLAQPQFVSSERDVANNFGKGAPTTPTGRSLGQFFNNGGRRALLARVAESDVQSGLDSLSNIASVSLLLLPDTGTMSAELADTVIATGQRWATDNSSFYIVDPPRQDSPREIERWLGRNAALRHDNSALYFPWIATAAGRSTPGGAVAGVYARTDSAHGVWKAPAGVEAGLRGIEAIAYPVSNDEQEVLNPLGINVLRDIGRGPVVWGARTLSSDPEWKYVPVRRLALFVEESIDQGTQWVVFEPNDEPLWAELRLAIEHFLEQLWRSGALVGAKATDAYFVRCGLGSTMTDTDIANGRVNIEVGFAPLKPAEFVIVRIQQKTVDPWPHQELKELLDVARTLEDGAGLTTLFIGPSDGGKQLAAAGLAGQLGHSLKRIDANTLVSKYIGETEKNLATVLQRAATADAILFFDEADALFGKRTGVSDAHDRFTGFGTKELLPGLSKHPGIVILDVSSNLDDQAAAMRVDFRSRDSVAGLHRPKPI